MSEDRIIDLEVKASLQEVSIEELKQALYETHLRLAKLEKDHKRLTERFEAISVASPVGPGNEKPPHY